MRRTVAKGRAPMPPGAMPANASLTRREGLDRAKALIAAGARLQPGGDDARRIIEGLTAEVERERRAAAKSRRRRARAARKENR